MRKIHALALLPLLLLAACGDQIPSLGFDWDFTPKAIKAMPAPLDLPEALEGGPLYVFDAETPDPTLKAYRALRKARAEEIVDLMDQELEQLEEVFEAMPKYRSAVITAESRIADALNPADPEQALMRAYASDAIQRLIVRTIKTTDAYVKLKALAESIEELREHPGKDANADTLPMLEYTQWVMTGNLVYALTREYASSQARAGSVIGALEAMTEKLDKKCRKEVRKGAKKIAKQIKKLDEKLQEALETHLTVLAAFDSLSAADYAFTMATIDFASESLPEIVRKANLVATGAVVTAEDQALAQSGAAFLKSFTDELRSGMAGIAPPPILRQVEGKSRAGLIPPFLGIAHAGTMDWLNTAGTVLTSGVKEMATGAYNMGRTMAEGPFIAARKIRHGVGTAVAFVDSNVGAAMDTGMNRYYGNALQDEREQMAETYARAQVAAIMGKQGAQTMRTARDYIDSVEKGIGKEVENVVGGAFNMAGYMLDKATGGAVQRVWGKDTVSWGAGKIAELTAGMATGFGKGILNLTNPDSSMEELFEGTIDTLFSVIGGSKAVAKASQVATGAKEAGKEALEKLSSVMARKQLQLEGEALKKSSDDLLRAVSSRLMTGEEISILCNNTRRIMENELREKALKDAEKSAVKILDDLVVNADAALAGNLREAREGAKDFVQESFENSLNGLKEAAGATFGSTKTEWFDNLVGSITDNAAKDTLKSLLLSPQDEESLRRIQAASTALSKLDPNDPKSKEALDKLLKVAEQTQKDLAEAEKKAEEKAMEQTAATVRQQVLGEMEKELGKAANTPVKATGSFSGDYKGSVSMQLVPGGGPVSGTVSTRYGSASISGSVDASGVLTANVSGTMSYDWYGDDGRLSTPVKKSCSLTASMTGTVGKRRASGSYGGSCAKEDDHGRWTASW